MKRSLLLALILQGTALAQNASVAGEVRALEGPPAARVSGVVKGIPQDALPGLRVVLMLANPPNGPLKILNTIIKADGSFEFTGISKGRYALRVVRTRTAETIDVPYAPVVSTLEVIDKDVRGLELGISSADVR